MSNDKFGGSRKKFLVWHCVMWLPLLMVIISSIFITDKKILMPLLLVGLGFWIFGMMKRGGLVW